MKGVGASHAIPTRRSLDASRSARRLLRDERGGQATLRSNNGGEFTSNAFKRILGGQGHQALAHHPLHAAVECTLNR